MSVQNNTKAKVVNILCPTRFFWGVPPEGRGRVFHSKSSRFPARLSPPTRTAPGFPLQPLTRAYRYPLTSHAGCEFNESTLILT